MRAISRRTASSSEEILSTSATSSPGRKMPAEIVFLWTSRPRNVGVVVVLDMDGWLLPYVATSASWWLIHARCGTGRPFHTDYTDATPTFRTTATAAPA